MIRLVICDCYRNPSISLRALSIGEFASRCRGSGRTDLPDTCNIDDAATGCCPACDDGDRRRDRSRYLTTRCRSSSSDSGGSVDHCCPGCLARNDDGSRYRCCCLCASVDLHEIAGPHSRCSKIGPGVFHCSRCGSGPGDCLRFASPAPSQWIPNMPVVRPRQLCPRPAEFPDFCSVCSLFSNTSRVSLGASKHHCMR